VRTLLLGLMLCAACGGDDGEPDFALIGPAEPVVLVRGQVGMVDVEVTRSGGLDDTVIVTASGLVAGITPSAVPLPEGTEMGTLQLSVEGSAALGPIEGAVLVGVAGELERMTPFEVEVVDP
jgi:hypothetical protein